MTRRKKNITKQDLAKNEGSTMKMASSFTLWSCSLLFAVASLSACLTPPASEENQQLVETPKKAATDTARERAIIREAARFHEFITQAKKHMDTKDWPAAERELGQAGEIKPDDLEVKRLLTKVQAEQGDPSAIARGALDGISAMRKIRMQETLLSHNRTYHEGLELLEQGKFFAAEALFKQARHLLVREQFLQLDESITGFNPELRHQELDGLVAKANREGIEARRQRERKEAAEAQRLLQEYRANQSIRREKEIEAIKKQAIGYAKAGMKEAALDEVEKLYKFDKISADFQAFEHEIRNKIREARTIVNKKLSKQQLELRQQDLGEAIIPYTEDINYPSREEWKVITSRTQSISTVAPGQSEEPENKKTRELLETTTVLNFDVADIRELNQEDGIYATLEDVIDHLKEQEVLEKVEEDIFTFHRELIGTEQLAQTFQDFRLRGSFTLEEVLRHILNQVDLTYTIQNGIVEISDKNTVSSSFQLRVYDVADLVAPLHDFPGPSLRQQSGSQIGETGRLNAENDDTESETALVEERVNKVLTMKVKDLRDNIRKSISQESWTDPENAEPGKGTIKNHKSNSLVVVQTPEVHRQIEGYLTKLRKLSGVLVKIELRIITIDDNFLRDVGVELKDLTQPHVFTETSRISTSGLSPITEIIGITTTSPLQGLPGLLSNEDIRNTVQAASLNDLSLSQITRITSEGGLQLTGQFLDDIDVRGILKAVEKTSRAQLLTAPMLTLFNTQQASILVGEQRSFIRDDTPQGSGETVVLNPEIGRVATGTLLDVRGVVSYDRRFVTVTIRPQITTLLGFDDADITRGSLEGGIAASSQIQLPRTLEQTLRTTVQVPDGGTVLIGGLRDVRLQERSQETPFLSNIPILGFLFSRQAEAAQKREIIVLLTTRIIVLDEEEERVR